MIDKGEETKKEGRQFCKVVFSSWAYNKWWILHLTDPSPTLSLISVSQNHPWWSIDSVQVAHIWTQRKSHRSQQQGSLLEVDGQQAPQGEALWVSTSGFHRACANLVTTMASGAKEEATFLYHPLKKIWLKWDLRGDWYTYGLKIPTTLAMLLAVPCTRESGNHSLVGEGVTGKKGYRTERAGFSQA